MRSSKTRKNLLKPKYSLLIKTKSKMGVNPGKLKKLIKKRKWKAVYFPLRFSHFKRNSYTLSLKKINKSLLKAQQTLGSIERRIRPTSDMFISNVLNKNFIDATSLHKAFSMFFNNDLLSLSKYPVHKMNSPKEKGLSFTLLNNKLRTIFFNQMYDNNSILNDQASKFNFFIRRYLTMIDLTKHYKVFAQNYKDRIKYLPSKSFLVLNRSSKLNFFVRSKNIYESHTVFGKYSSIFLNNFKMNLFKLKAFKLFYGFINKKSIKRLILKSLVKGKRKNFQLLLTKSLELKLDVLIHKLRWSKTVLDSKNLLKHNDIYLNHLKTTFKKSVLNVGDILQVKKDKTFVVYQHLYTASSNYKRIHPKFRNKPQHFVTLWHLFLENLRNQNKMIIGQFPRRFKNAQMWENLKFNVRRTSDIQKSFIVNPRILRTDEKKPMFFVFQRLKEFNKKFSQRLLKTLNFYLRLKKIPQTGLLRCMKQRTNLTFVDKKHNFSVFYFFLDKLQYIQKFTYVKYLSNFNQRLITLMILKKRRARALKVGAKYAESFSKILWDRPVDNFLKQTPKHFLTGVHLTFLLQQQYHKNLTARRKIHLNASNGSFISNLETLEKQFLYGGFSKFFFQNIVLDNGTAQRSLLKRLKLAISLKKKKKEASSTKTKVFSKNEMHLRSARLKVAHYRIGFHQLLRVKWHKFLNRRPRYYRILIEDGRFLVEKRTLRDLKTAFFDSHVLVNILIAAKFNKLKLKFFNKFSKFLEQTFDFNLKMTSRSKKVELTPEIARLFLKTVDENSKLKASSKGFFLNDELGQVDHKLVSHQKLLTDVHDIKKKTSGVKWHKFSFLPSKKKKVFWGIKKALQSGLFFAKSGATNTVRQRHKFKNALTLSYKILLLNELQSVTPHLLNKSVSDSYLTNLFKNKIVKNKSKLLKYRKTFASLLQPAYVESAYNTAIIAEYPNPQTCFTEYNSFFLDKNNLFLAIK